MIKDEHTLKMLPTMNPSRRMYTLMKKEDKIRVIKKAFNLTHGKGKRKRKPRRK